MGVKKISNGKELKLAIAELESKLNVNETIIRHNITELKEGLEPKRLFANTFSRLAETPGIKKIILNTAVGFVLGYVSRKSASIFNETTVTAFAENFVNQNINRIEKNAPNNLISRCICFVRKYTPPTSPLYGFLKY